MIRSAVILARGLGTRMRRDEAGAMLDEGQSRAAAMGMKGMIPIGRPFMDYLISSLADAGIRRVGLVIGPEHDQVRMYYSSGIEVTRVQIEFAIQEHPRGTADAVLAARDFAGDDPFLVLNSDNYYPVDAIRQLMAVDGCGLIGFHHDALVAESNIPSARVRHFALIERDANGLLRSLIEKPVEATYESLLGSSLISMKLWAFNSAIFEACRRVQPSARGELELQDAVRIARDDLGQPFTVVPFAGGVLDLSTRGDIASVAARLSGVRVVL